MRGVWAWLGCFLLAGCGQVLERESAADAAAYPDAHTLDDGGPLGDTRDDPPPRCDESPCLDLLYVISNAPTMAEEQASLVAQAVHVLGILTTGDTDGDGIADLPSVRDVNIGVITTDLGGRWCESPSGDDALLGAGTASCSVSPFVQFRPGVAFERFESEVSCHLAVGDRGCAFAQPLEAMLKALTPSTSELRFSNGTLGHGDRANAGFLREDSVLAVIFVDDHDDCSRRADADVGPVEGLEASRACRDNIDALHVVNRAVDGLMAVHPYRNVIGVTAGAPPETVSDPTNLQLETVLAHPLMAVQIDSTAPRRNTVSCNVPGRGLAFPPVRYIRALLEFEERGAEVSLDSICQSDHGPALDRILRLLLPE